MTKLTSAQQEGPPIHPMGVRLRQQIFLRWLAVLGQGLAVIIVGPFMGFPLPLPELVFFIAVSGALNLWLELRYPMTHRLSNDEAVRYLAYDIVQISVLLYLTGGLLNPFVLMILAPVLISASVLTGRTTVLLVMLAATIVSVLTFEHRPLPWGGDGTSPQLPQLYIFGIWSALVLSLFFMSSYIYRVSSERRLMSSALFATQQVLSREQRLSALDGLAAAAAHQLGTPLGTIGLIAGELRLQDGLPDEVAEDIELLVREARRCRDILSALTDGLEQEDTVFSHISLQTLLEEAVLETNQPDKDIEIRCSGAGTMPKLRRQAEMIYGLGNLVENAVDFAATKVDISAEYDAQGINISIADDGPGFKPDVLSRLGEPWTTSRPSQGGGAQSGMGLGFFIAKTLLERTGAQLVARNRAQGGAEVKLTWPRGRIEADGQGD